MDAANLKTSAEGHTIMHYFEQCRLEAYPDPGTGGAPWTIGWGDTGPDVVPGLVITQEEADQRYANRLHREFEPGVVDLLQREPTQAQFDALVSLAYNIGLANFRGSTVLRKFNQGDDIGAADAILMWNKAGGKVMLGLKRRRTAERARFLGASGKQATAVGAAVSS
uniref:Lysozyme n=1 Tax=Variovorax paradoxus (strain S110) TaxID=543728 RepID=C5CJR6_VARPS